MGVALRAGPKVSSQRQGGSPLGRQKEKDFGKLKEWHLPSRLYTQPSGCSGVVQRSSMTINRQRGRQRGGEMG